MMPFTIELDFLLTKKVALHLFSLIILQKSKLILYLWKKHRLFVMLTFSLSQFLIKIKITIITIHFQKNVHIKTIYYNKIDASEGIDFNKTNKSR